MKANSYANSIQVSTDPESVFRAITREINMWWTTASNQASKKGDSLTVRFERGTRWIMTVAEAVPNRSLVWEVVEAYHIQGPTVR